MPADHRQLYTELYQSLQGPRLYSAPWWLDATCGPGGWEVVRSDVNGNPMLLPYCSRRIRGMQAMITPPVTQWLDVLSTVPVDDYAKLTFDFPKVAITDINLRPGMAVTPVAGFRISTQYSYILPAEPDANAIVSNYSDTVRHNVRQSDGQPVIHKSADVRRLVDLYAAVFTQRKVKQPWWVEGVLPRLASVLLERGQGEIRFAVQQDTIIACSLVAWDDAHAYYLVGGRQGGEKGQSAHTLLLHDAIVEAGRLGLDFDFEGSMIPGVASFFQSFGAKPVPFSRLRRYRGAGMLWSLLR